MICPHCKKEIKNKIKYDAATFEKIYRELYPRKAGKTAGIKKLVKTIKTEKQLNDLIGAVHNYRIEIQKEKTEKQYIKHFSTFANNWEDYLETEVAIEKEIELKAVEARAQFQKQLEKEMGEAPKGW